MTKTTAQLNRTQTPSPTRESGKPQASSGGDASFRKDFFLVAVNMSWQLAVAVLVPILGGYWLDQELHTSPLLIIIGFILALVGMTAVLWSSSQKANVIGDSHGGSAS